MTKNYCFVMLMFLALFAVSGAQTSWENIPSGTTNSLNSITWNNNLFIAAGKAGILLTSSDGKTWTSHTLKYNWALPYLTSSTWTGSQFVLTSSNMDCYTSADGSTWTLQPTTNDLYMAYSIVWADTQFVVVGANGRISTSPEIFKWTTRNQNTSEWFCSVAWSGSLFVTVGRGGTIMTSTDGITWTKQPSEYTDWLLSVVWTGTQFVAVGGSQSGSSTVRTSPDGLVWSVRSCDVGKQLFSVTWTGTSLVAVGQSGTVVTSPDGVTWKTEVSGTASFLRSVVSTDSLLLAVGDGGVMRNSPLDNGIKDVMPVLLLPQMNSKSTLNPVLFSWQSCTNAKGYQIEVSTDSTFKEILKDTMITSDSVAHLEGLSSGTLYFWHVRAHCAGGLSRWSKVNRFTTENSHTGILQENKSSQDGLMLNPSPFNPTTQLQFGLEQTDCVRLMVFDANGKLVSTLIEGSLSAGHHSIGWNGSGMASGIYIFKLKTGHGSQTKQAVLMR